MEVGESAWMHEAPALPGRVYRTVIPVETTTSALEICAFVIECDVDGEGGGVMVWSEVGLSSRGVFHHKVHDGVALGVVAREDFQSDRRDELADEVQPLLIVAYLLHVDVVCGHGLVAASDSLILVSPSRPGSVVFHLLHNLVTRPFREHREPEHIWTRLFQEVFCEDACVVGVDVLFFPIHWVFKYLPQIAVVMRCVIVSSGN